MAKEQTDSLVQVYDPIINAILAKINLQMHQIWLVTSAGRAEGKTMTALGLALSLAKRKRKILLIDGNLRNPAIDRYCEVKKSPGLAEIVRNGLNVKDVIKTVSGYEIQIVTSGDVHIDPFELLTSQRIRAFVDEMKSHFDFTIIDSSAVETAIDPLLLAPLMDGVLLVITAGKTRRYAVADAQKKLVDAGGKILGVILNRHRDPVPRIIRKSFSW